MLIYNIPTFALNRYQDKTVTVRSGDARALVEAFSTVPRDNLWSLQVLSMDCDADALLHLSDQVSIDLVVNNPTGEFSRLYRFAELPHKHTLRVTVPAVPGMTKAVKISQALNFGVKLEINQPGANVVDELVALAEYYLRGVTVSHPIEPFHSLFLSFYSGRPTNLWSLQEEDPAVDRYVTDAGPTAFSSRLASLGIPEHRFVDFLKEHTSTCREVGECATCEWFSRCQGYFKLPAKGYQCEHVKRLFALLNEAAAEMRKDEERFVELHGPAKSDSDSNQSPQRSTLNEPEGLKTNGCSDAEDAATAEKQALSSFSMRRLDHRLEEFTRHSWATAEAKAVWESRIRKVDACKAELEWRTILEGFRVCALKSIAPNQVETLRAMLAPHGLVVVPMEKIAATCVSSIRPPRDGEPFHYRCAIGRISDVKLLESAHLSHDEETVGRLLGYPSCCTAFFKQVWVNEQFLDTTWPMAQNTVGKRSITLTHVEVPKSSCSVLLRWLGLRKVFHLPCGFDCKPSVELADKHTELARSAGFGQEMEWLEEMLSWPVEWTALNGLAEITTPVGTISTVTDATAETYRVSYKGAGSAKARGVGQAFQPAIGRMVKVPDDSLDEPFRYLEWYYADNGFSSRDGMDQFHEPIVKLAGETLSQGTGDVLDLGCGNGVLVKKICRSNSRLIPWGVDISDNNIAHARQLSPQFSDGFVVADIFDDCTVWSEDREFELVILSLVRLTEVPEKQAEKLLRRIREHARNLLVYSYEGDGSLEGLARKTGVTLSGKRSGENVALAYLEKIQPEFGN